MQALYYTLLQTNAVRIHQLKVNEVDAEVHNELMTSLMPLHTREQLKKLISI